MLGRGCEPPEPKWKLKFPLASRRHCWFQFADDAIVVVDVSRGGTFINGTAVSRSKGSKLVKGDILSLVTPVTSITETLLDSKFCAFKVHINTAQLTSIKSDFTNPTDTLGSSTDRPDRPLVSFPIARPLPVATSSSSGYVEAQDFLERAGLPTETEARNLSAEPEPEEGPEENEKPEAAEPQEPEQEHSDQQVRCVGIHVCRLFRNDTEANIMFHCVSLCIHYIMWCNDSCGGSPPPPVTHRGHGNGGIALTTSTWIYCTRAAGAVCNH